MRLLEPSPGEVADRSTILELKHEAAVKQGFPTDHFDAEYEELDQYLQRPQFRTTVETKDKYYALRKELLGVNRKLWHNEDEIRSLPSVDACTADNVTRLAVLCKEVADLNDARSELVSRLNQLFNISGREKIYSCATPK